MTRGLAVYVKDLARIKTTVQLFNTQHWMIEGENAYRYTTLFEKGTSHCSTIKFKWSSNNDTGK